MQVTTQQILFLSDLHLDQQTPALLSSFTDFLQTLETQQGLVDCTVFILGDLFEAWLGDDQLDQIQAKSASDSAIASIISQLQHLARLAPTYFIHGNRDFLIGQSFEQQMGITCLEEVTTIEFHGFTILLCHGDHLCVQDEQYMHFREKVRSPAWQEWFTTQSFAKRLQIAEQLRATSRETSLHKTAEILDVSSFAVAELLNHHQVDLLIHGHTHRPAIHQPATHHALQAQPPKAQTPRIVLGDWDPRPSWLTLSLATPNLVASLSARDWQQKLILKPSPKLSNMSL